MAILIEEQEAKKIEELTAEAESMTEEVGNRKDLKEKRGITKQTLYDGSKKLKHIVPKGKRI
jgi:hypothetical protein